ncbi:Flp family type IVb pilin [uncultured Caballeronia sp.]|jgi:pilus assembly protein Flp/PilA|uniref:Flp family type IVb pilin n=1 Tax=uncultured Caballeronia sp. TaxID=1827198 RepID=UPI001576716E
MSNFIKRFSRDERGVTAIEYGIIAGIIAAALVLALAPLTTALTNTFSAISKAL